MQFNIGGYCFSITLNRMVKTDKGYDCSYQFTTEGESLLIKAINAAMQSSIDEGGKGKVVPLHGMIDLESGKIYIGSLGSVRHDRSCVDSAMLCFTEEPCFEHKKPGLFERGFYSPRIESYQKRYSPGPTAHQQLLFHAVQKLQVSADDAKSKRGFAFQIQVTDKQVSFIVDGNSLSINETAQYLRTKHAPQHYLTDEEAKNDVLKASKEFSSFCEEWILMNLAKSCQSVLESNNAKLFQHGCSSAASATSAAAPVSSSSQPQSASLILMCQ